MKAAKSVRRSFVIPSKLIDEVLSLDAADKTMNLNKLVTIALQEYVDNKKRREFEKSMLAMGTDPDILRECASINEDFTATETDGLATKE